jgi:hypothetical protein
VPKTECGSIWENTVTSIWDGVEVVGCGGGGGGGGGAKWRWFEALLYWSVDGGTR